MHFAMLVWCFRIVFITFIYRLQLKQIYSHNYLINYSSLVPNTSGSRDYENKINKKLASWSDG